MLDFDARQARDFFAQKLAFVTGPFELSGQMRRNEPITVVDVRLPSDYQAGHIPGARNLPQGQLFNPDNSWKQDEALRSAFADAKVDLEEGLIRTAQWYAAEMDLPLAIPGMSS